MAPRLSLAAAAVWLAIKVALGYLFAANPGGALEWHLAKNLDVLRGVVAFADVMHTPLLAPMAHAIPWCWLQFLAALNFVWVLVPVRWRAKDPFLRTLALLIPLHLGLMVLFGNLVERRIYLDVLPVVLPLALQTFFPAAPVSSLGEIDVAQPPPAVRVPGGAQQADTAEGGCATQARKP